MYILTTFYFTFGIEFKKREFFNYKELPKKLDFNKVRTNIHLFLMGESKCIYIEALLKINGIISLQFNSIRSKIHD